jgi:hypothetical protein
MVKRILRRLGEALQVIAEEEMGIKQQPVIQPQVKTLIDKTTVELTYFIHRKHQALVKIHSLQRDRVLIFEKVMEDENKLEAFLGQLRSSEMPVMWEHKDDIIREGKEFGKLLEVEIKLMEFLGKLKQLEMELLNKLPEWAGEEIIPDSVIGFIRDLLVRKPEVGHVRDEGELINVLAQTKDIGTLRIIRILQNVDKRYSGLLEHEGELLTQEDIRLLIRDKFETIQREWHQIKNFNNEETELISLLNEKMIIQNTTLARIKDQLKMHESDISAKKFLKAVGVIDKVIDEIEYANFDGAQRLIRANIRFFSKDQAKIMQGLILPIMQKKFNDAEKLLSPKDIKLHIPQDRIERLKKIVQNPNPLLTGYQWKLRMNSPQNGSILFFRKHIENLNAEVIEGPNMEDINAGRINNLKFYWYVEQSQLLNWYIEGGDAMEGSPLRQLVHIGKTGNSREQISAQIFKFYEQPEKNRARLVVYLVNTRANKAVGATQIDIKLELPGIRINLMNAVLRERTIIEKIQSRLRRLGGRHPKIQKATQLTIKALEELKEIKQKGAIAYINELLVSLRVIPDDVLEGLAEDLRQMEEQRVLAVLEEVQMATARQKPKEEPRKESQATPQLRIQLTVIPEEARNEPGAPSGTEITVTYETDGTPPMELKYILWGPSGRIDSKSGNVNEASGTLFRRRCYEAGLYAATAHITDSTGRGEGEENIIQIGFYIAPESPKPTKPQYILSQDEIDALLRTLEEKK